MGSSGVALITRVVSTLYRIRRMVGKYPVIPLCGSTRFMDAFMEAQKRLTLEGNIVIRPF